MIQSRSIVNSLLLILLLFTYCFQAVDANQKDKPDQLKVIFFYTPGCRLCAPTRKAVDSARQRFGDQIRVEEVDLSLAGIEGAKRLFSLLDRHGVKGTPSLAVFMGSRCLSGGESIVRDLDKTIGNTLAGSDDEEHGRRPLQVNRLGFWTITGAALADGINPCAFATIVLFVSMMTTAGRNRREIVAMGASFTLAVYVTYLLIGLALYRILQHLASFLILSDLLFAAAFLACILFAVFSLYDAVILSKSGGMEKTILHLPERLRKRIRKTLSQGVRTRTMLLGSLIAGLTVSLLESVCTGQVYFPVIAGLVREDNEVFQGMVLLLWYNFVFIIPLLCILLLSLFGAQSHRIASFARRHMPTVKILLAFVFLLMAAWMWPGIVWPPGAR